jgi:phosphoribosyl-ATP pyrophosphohydrolase
MTRAKKSYRLELTKEQQALVLQKTGVEAKELELTADELKTQTEPKPVGDQS